MAAAGPTSLSQKSKSATLTFMLKKMAGSFSYISQEKGLISEALDKIVIILASKIV